MAHDPAAGARAPRAPWEHPPWEDQVQRNARITEASARAAGKRTGILAGSMLLLVCAGSLWAILAASTGKAPSPVDLPRSPTLLAGLLAALFLATTVTGIGFLTLARQNRRLARTLLALAEDQAALARGAAETAEIARGLRYRLYGAPDGSAAPPPQTTTPAPAVDELAPRALEGADHATPGFPR